MSITYEISCLNSEFGKSRQIYVKSRRSGCLAKPGDDVAKRPITNDGLQAVHRIRGSITLTHLTTSAASRDRDKVIKRRQLCSAYYAGRAKYICSDAVNLCAIDRHLRRTYCVWCG